MNRVLVLELAVGVHLLAALVHGAVHGWLPVPVPAWQYAVAGLTVAVLPLVGLAVARSGRVRAGTVLVAVGGLAALAFEGLAHFAVQNPDHVSSVADGKAAFSVTAALSTLGDVLVVLAAGWLLWTYSQGRPARSAIDSST